MKNFVAEVSWRVRDDLGDVRVPSAVLKTLVDHFDGIEGDLLVLGRYVRGRRR